MHVYTPSVECMQIYITQTHTHTHTHIIYNTNTLNINSDLQFAPTDFHPYIDEHIHTQSHKYIHTSISGTKKTQKKAAMDTVRQEPRVLTTNQGHIMIRIADVEW